MIRQNKSTKSDGRRHNRELVLRAIYAGKATNRAALAQETDLTKPTISDLVAELIDEGLVSEGGLGESTESGGKRPRLLEFIPESQQVVGISLTQTYISGVLSNLNRQVVAEHHVELSPDDDVVRALIEVINGLIAQQDAPIRAIGVGLSSIDDAGLKIEAEGQHITLTEVLTKHYDIPVYTSNSTELAARAQFKLYNLKNNPRLLTLLIGTRVGIGMVLGDSVYHIGKGIGYLQVGDGRLDERLSWLAVKARASELMLEYQSPWLNNPDLTYLHIRYAAHHGDSAAIKLLGEMSEWVAEIIAWGVAFIDPTHITLAGSIANLGEPFLRQVVQLVSERTAPQLIEAIHFSVDGTENLVAIGAAAKVIEAELGLI